MINLDNMRAVVVQAINPELIALSEDGSSGRLVEKGDPDELIIQLNLNFVDHANLVKLAEAGIQAMVAREVILKEMRASPPHPLTAEEIDILMNNARRLRHEAEELSSRIRRPGPTQR